MLLTRAKTDTSFEFQCVLVMYVMMVAPEKSIFKELNEHLGESEREKR